MSSETPKYFGDWEVLAYNCEKDKHGKSVSLCRCKCFYEAKILTTVLKAGKSLSCKTCAGERFWEKRKNPM